VQNGPRLVEELLQLGVGFSREEQGGLALGREGGHSRRRIVHARDRTGQAVEQALLAAATAHPHITIYEHFLALELVVEPAAAPGGRPRCWGAYALDRLNGKVRGFAAPTTMLATGGCGRVYLYTSNPDICTGDGLAMAYRAGARVANLEFVQFHPTCLYHEGKFRNFLITEAVRGEGAELVDADGTPFMTRYDERGSLASRDVVARAVDSEMKQRGARHVYLDMRGIGEEKLRTRFPQIFERCREAGYDPAGAPVPVVPAAHYMCGGVLTDDMGRTDVEGLLACGEVACTGLHGANRLASNSLLEAPVFADRAAQVARERPRERPPADLPRWISGERERPRETVIFEHDWEEVRRLMWDYVGIVRTDERLTLAHERLGLLRRQIEDYTERFELHPDLVELRNIALVSQLIVRSALARPESRGLHYNLDHPERDPRRDGKDTVLEPPGEAGRGLAGLAGA